MQCDVTCLRQYRPPFSVDVCTVRNLSLRCGGMSRSDRCTALSMAPVCSVLKSGPEWLEVTTTTIISKFLTRTKDFSRCDLILPRSPEGCDVALIPRIQECFGSVLGQGNAGLAVQTGSQSRPSTSFSIHCSRIIPQFDAT